MKKSLLILLIGTLSACLYANEYDFDQDGLAYYITTFQDYKVVAVGTDWILDCPSEVVIPTTVTYNKTTYPVAEVQKSGFMPTSTEITSVTLPSTVYKIGEFAFNGTKISSMDLSHVSNIGKMAFSSCEQLKDFSKIKFGIITEIPWGCFGSCGFSGTVTIPATVHYIHFAAFQDCKDITTVVWNTLNQATLDTIAFGGCKSLKSITLPLNLIKIGCMAFYNCTSLKEITIPSTTQVIEDMAFDGSGIQKIIVKAIAPPKATATTDKSGTFYGVDKSIPVIVPKGTADLYRAATGWKEFKSISDGTDILEVPIDQIDLNKAEFYTMTGQPVSYTNPLPKGTYIVRQANKSSKIIIQ